MDIRGEGGRAAEARPIALLEPLGIAWGYPVAIYDGEVPADLSKVLDGVLHILVALISVAGTFAVSLYALTAIIRWW